MRKNRHRQEGERCAYCLAAWPCPASTGAKHSSGVQEWSTDTMLQEHLVESNRRLEVNRRINRIAKALGVELQVPDFCTGIMVDTDILLQILERCSEEEVIT